MLKNRIFKKGNFGNRSASKWAVDNHDLLGIVGVAAIACGLYQFGSAVWLIYIGSVLLIFGIVGAMRS